MVTKLRKKIIAGNWKMNKSVGEAEDLANGIKLELAECKEVDVVLCPPFTALKTVGDLLRFGQVKLAAQNLQFSGQTVTITARLRPLIGNSRQLLLR